MSLSLEDTWELLRSGLPCWVLVSVIVLGAHVSSVGGMQDFSVYRMQHFDLHGLHYGSRTAVVNMEAKGALSTMISRRCVIVKWAELTSETLLDLVNKGAGAVLVLLPRELSTIEDDELQMWRELESHLLSTEIQIPVYFAFEDDQTLEVFNHTRLWAEGERDSSAAASLGRMLSGYSYQLITEAVVEPQVMAGLRITSIMGKLSGQGLEQSLPTMALLAHYDAFGLAPSLSFGPDSNGSGVAALLELARLFSRLYSDPKQRPKYNLVFALVGGDKLNYFGTKSLLDEQLDDDSSRLVEADYTLVLDSLATPPTPEAPPPSLYAHVSKPPKEGSRQQQVLVALNQSARLAGPEGQVTLVHKKIRLSEEHLAWGHERFSMRRLPALTLSTHSTHTDLRRASMFTDSSDVDVKVLVGNVKIIAEALARHIYNLSTDNVFGGTEVFTGDQAVHEDYLTAWLEFLSLHPRSPQLMEREHMVVAGLEKAMSRYLHDVVKISHKPEKSDPEFVVYDVPSTIMHAYKVKPAIFDLFLAIGILAYVGLLYIVLKNFSRVFPLLQSLPTLVKVKTE